MYPQYLSVIIQSYLPTNAFEDSLSLTHHPPSVTPPPPPPPPPSLSHSHPLLRSESYSKHRLSRGELQKSPNILQSLQPHTLRLNLLYVISLQNCSFLCALKYLRACQQSEPRAPRQTDRQAGCDTHAIIRSRKPAPDRNAEYHGQAGERAWAKSMLFILF